MSIKYDIVKLEEGHHIELLKCFTSFDSSSSPKDSQKKNGLIVIFPGNPGIVNFYEYFATKLNETTGLPVVGISFTGHMYDSSGQIGSWQPRTLSEQVSDRLKFLETKLLQDDDIQAHVSESARLIFIGHSIGCYTILEVLDQMSSQMRERVSKAFLLMPTVEYMKETPNGKRLTFVSKYFPWFIYFLSFIISVLPDSIKEFLVDRFTSFDYESDTNLVDGLRDIVLNMYEMIHVREPNLKSIKQNGSKLTFYYGTKDKWCPYKYYVRMRAFVDEMTDNGEKDDRNNNKPTLILDDNDIEHAFTVFKNQCDFFVNLINDSA